MEERKAVHVSAHQRGNTYNKHCLVAWMRSFFHLKYLFLTLVNTQLTDIYTTSTESEFIPDCSCERVRVLQNPWFCSNAQHCQKSKRKKSVFTKRSVTLHLQYEGLLWRYTHVYLKIYIIYARTARGWDAGIQHVLWQRQPYQNRQVM